MNFPALDEKTFCETCARPDNMFYLILSFYLPRDSWDHFCGQSEGQYSPIVDSSTSPSLTQLFLFLTAPSARSFLKYQVNFQHKLNFSFILLVPINLCANHELSPRPTFLFQNSPELHFSSFTCERFTDVKKVYPIFKG